MEEETGAVGKKIQPTTNKVDEERTSAGEQDIAEEGDTNEQTNHRPLLN